MLVAMSVARPARLELEDVVSMHLRLEIKFSYTGNLTNEREFD